MSPQAPRLLIAYIIRKFNALPPTCQYTGRASLPLCPCAPPQPGSASARSLLDDPWPQKLLCCAASRRQPLASRPWNGCSSSTGPLAHDCSLGSRTKRRRPLDRSGRLGTAICQSRKGSSVLPSPSLLASFCGFCCFWLKAAPCLCSGPRPLGAREEALIDLAMQPTVSADWKRTVEQADGRSIGWRRN